MSRTSVLARLALLGWLVLPAACATPRASSLPEEAPGRVKTSPLSGGRVRLSFEPVAPNPSLEAMSVEEAQVVLTVLHSVVLAERPEIRILPSYRLGLMNEVDARGWERYLREQFLARFGGSVLPLPMSWEQSRLYQ